MTTRVVTAHALTKKSADDRTLAVKRAITFVAPVDADKATLLEAAKVSFALAGFGFATGIKIDP